MYSYIRNAQTLAITHPGMALFVVAIYRVLILNTQIISMSKGYYKYVEDVLSGKIVAGENIKLAC